MRIYCTGTIILFMELILKGFIGGILIVGIGFFSRRSDNVLAAVLIQLPVITMMGFWAVSREGGSHDMSRLAIAALLSAPLFWAAVVPVWLLGREGCPVWLVFLVALLSWSIITVLWVWALRGRI